MTGFFFILLLLNAQGTPSESLANEPVSIQDPFPRTECIDYDYYKSMKKKGVLPDYGEWNYKVKRDRLVVYSPEPTWPEQERWFVFVLCDSETKKRVEGVQLYLVSYTRSPRREKDTPAISDLEGTGTSEFLIFRRTEAEAWGPDGMYRVVQVPQWKINTGLIVTSDPPLEGKDREPLSHALVPRWESLPSEYEALLIHVILMDTDPRLKFPIP